jgi:preprotein translocase subunit SecB
MPNLRLIEYRIRKFDFSFKDAKKLLLKFELTPSMNFSDEKCELAIKIQIRGEDGRKIPLKLDLDIVGKFQAEELKESEIAQWCKSKGAYELIQVARSAVLSFTLQAGMNPGLIIPPINLDKLFEKEKGEKN